MSIASTKRKCVAHAPINIGVSNIDEDSNDAKILLIRKKYSIAICGKCHKYLQKLTAIIYLQASIYEVIG